MDVNWAPILPGLCLLGAGFLAIAIDLFLKKEADRWPLDIVSYLGLGGSIYLLFVTDKPVAGFGRGVVLDPWAAMLSLAVAAATGLLIMMSGHDVRRRRIPFGEFHGLVLMSAAGMMFLVSANDFINLFLSLEIVSVAAYVLTGVTRRNPRSNEAAVKYLVTGGFASAFLLFGIAFLYGATGSFKFEEIGAALAQGGDSRLLSLGAGLLLVGLGFKVGAVPFHMWVPDVYEGAPTPVTAFMSAAVKVAGFGAAGRVVATALHARPDLWGGVLAILAILTVVVGNLLALRQQSVKRMLAYSSVAHTGYMLIGLASMRGASGGFHAGGLQAAGFYLTVYTFMTVGAFAFLVYIGREVGVPGTTQVEWQDGEAIEDFSGLAQRRPWAAFFMTIFMISLAGIPPTAGFFGKFYLFKFAVEQGQWELALIGVLGSLVSLYYYLRVVVFMYMKEPGPADEKPHPSVGLVVFLTALLTLYLGVHPSLLARVASTVFAP